MDLQIVSGEPRIQDIRLAEALEFKVPRQIRELIKRNIVELERYGPLACGTTMVEIGSGAKRETAEYYLNEAQALLICMKSDAPRAEDGRAEIIAVFQAWRHGKMAPATSAPVTLQDLRAELEPIRDHLVRHDGNIAYLIQMGGEHGDQLRALVPDRHFSKEDKRRFAFVVWKKYHGECPNCRDVKIIDEQGEPIRGIAQCDHVRGHNLNGPHDGWYVCAGCNQKLRDYSIRAESMNAHREFIRILKKMFCGHPAKEPKKLAGPSPQNSFEF